MSPRACPHSTSRIPSLQPSQPNGLDREIKPETLFSSACGLNLVFLRSESISQSIKTYSLSCRQVKGRPDRSAPHRQRLKPLH